MDLHFVTTDDDRRRFASWLVGPHKRIAVDIETGGLDPWHEELRMVQFGDRETGWAIPYPENSTLITNALAMAPTSFTAHRKKFEEQFCWRNGLPATRFASDTKVMLHLLDTVDSSLKSNAERRLDPEWGEFEDRLDAVMKKNRWTWRTVPKDCLEYWMYAAVDTVMTARIEELVWPEVEEKYLDLYWMELAVSDAVVEAERRGMCVDLDYTRRQRDRLVDEVGRHAAGWSDINLGSPTQVGRALEDAGFCLPRTKTGKPSVTDDVVSDIDHPLARARETHMELTKMLGYFTSYIELEVDGRIHPTINTVGPRTGRMSCKNPNLQNVPRGSVARPAFVASPGCVLVRADYSQIEYRIFASMADEPAMIEAFLDGKDLHAETARLIYGHDPDVDERSTAKNGNFSTLFCAGIPRFAKTAGIPIAEARDFREKYEARFPKVKLFIPAVIRYVKANGMAVDTAYGRRCPVEQGRPYAGVNYMVQGTAADVLKQAIVNVSGTEWDDYFVLPVHDELIFDVPEELADRLVADLPELMEVRGKFQVPLTIEVKRQHRWGVDDEEEVIAA